MSNALLVLLSLAVIGGWLASGLYFLDLGEEAIILRLGKHHRTENREGWNWHWPEPLEYETAVNVRGVRTEEFGTSREGERSLSFEQPEEQSLSRDEMDQRERTRELQQSQQHIQSKIDREAAAAKDEGYFIQTVDSNIVNVSFEIQYTIADAYSFYYGMRSPRSILKEATQAAVREVIGGKKIDEVLFSRRHQIELQAQTILDETLASYFAERGGNAPFEIDKINLQRVHPPAQVQAAFEDVVAAQQDAVRSVSQATGDSREILERAGAKASELEESSAAYKDARIFKSQGAATRFKALVAEYERAPVVTRRRLYLETMEEILPNIQKLIVEPDTVSVMPFMPMPTQSTSGSTVPRVSTGMGGAAAAGGTP
jgi:membrane protease subunit HflK